MLPYPHPMEFGTKNGNHNNAPPIANVLSNSILDLKLELLDHDFGIHNLSSSRSYFQDFQNLDHFPMTALSINPVVGMQTIGFDPSDPFCHGSTADFGISAFRPNEESGCNVATVQDFCDGRFLNFPERKDPLMEIGTALKYHLPEPVRITVPDESSCVTADNINCHKDGKKRNKNENQNSNSKESECASTKRSNRSRQKSKSAKGQWSVEEDRLLIHLVEKYGERKWSNIAQMLKGRIGKQCRERWHNHLRPDIKVSSEFSYFLNNKDVWSEEEDRVLIEVHAKVGNKWAEIAKSLCGRTENSIKNHWNATKRRQFSKRKCRTKWPRPSSLLQNYIKSLNLEKGSSSRSGTIEPPPAADPGINNASVTATKPPEIEFCQDDDMVPEHDLKEVLEFTFGDDHLFQGRSMDSFMDGIPVGPPPEIDDEPWFDVELPFDMHPLMQSEVNTELNFFDGNVNI